MDPLSKNLSPSVFIFNVNDLLITKSDNELTENVNFCGTENFSLSKNDLNARLGEVTYPGEWKAIAPKKFKELFSHIDQKNKCGLNTSVVFITKSCLNTDEIFEQFKKIYSDDNGDFLKHTAHQFFNTLNLVEYGTCDSSKLSKPDLFDKISLDLQEDEVNPDTILYDIANKKLPDFFEKILSCFAEDIQKSTIHYFDNNEENLSTALSEKFNIVKFPKVIKESDEVKSTGSFRSAIDSICFIFEKYEWSLRDAEYAKKCKEEKALKPSRIVHQKEFSFDEPYESPFSTSESHEVSRTVFDLPVDEQEEYFEYLSNFYEDETREEVIARIRASLANTIATPEANLVDNDDGNPIANDPIFDAPEYLDDITLPKKPTVFDTGKFINPDYTVSYAEKNAQRRAERQARANKNAGETNRFAPAIVKETEPAKEAFVSNDAMHDFPVVDENVFGDDYNLFGNASFNYQETSDYKPIDYDSVFTPASDDEDDNAKPQKVCNREEDDTDGFNLFNAAPSWFGQQEIRSKHPSAYHAQKPELNPLF